MSKPAITGSTIASAQTVAIPAHNVGDLIVIYAMRQSASAVTVPSSSGTVPAWVTIDNGANVGSSSQSERTSYFIATANNHTSGTWTNTGTTFSGMLVAVVISGADFTATVGGHATSASASSLVAVSAPSVTLTSGDGSSLLLHFFTHVRTTAWSTPAAGYTNVAAFTNASGYGSSVNTKDDTTSDGSVSQGVTATTPASVGVGATVEILAIATQAVAPTGIVSGGAFGTAAVSRGSVAVSPTGISSGQAFGTAVVGRGAVALHPTGVASAQSFGTLTVARGSVTVSPAGIASAQAFGTAAVGRGAVNASPTGIGTSGAFGSATVTSPAGISPTGISSGEAFGGPVVNEAGGTQHLLPAGVASSETFGTPTGAPGSVAVSPTGIASASAFGNLTLKVYITADGIVSGETFGDADAAPGAVTITPTGVGSGEAFGGTTAIRGLKVSPTGIPGILGQFAFGTPTVAPVSPDTPILRLAGIVSGEAFGRPTITGGVTLVATRRTSVIAAEDRTTTVTGSRRTIIT